MVNSILYGGSCGVGMDAIGFRPRAEQEQILAYSGGRMGVSAVPGAGKTYVLAALAAKLVAEAIDDDQEVLIVTLVNSAVESIQHRTGQLVGGRGLLANVGYRVRTLHGLAHDIVRERPGLVGLADDFEIVDERTAEMIREDVVEVWLRGHPDAADAFLSPDLADQQREWVLRTQWPDAVRSLATAFISRAKDLFLSPEGVLERLGSRTDHLALALSRMGAEIYAEYQKSLHYRGGVDFDDLIRLALVALRQDADMLQRMRRQWPFILEDEAQDSSHSQEAILGLIAGPHGNWIRVGDPNQAINTTFTTADPRFLREFLHKPGVVEMPLPRSGRSQRHIIDLANYLVSWAMSEHPEPLARVALRAPPSIEPTSVGDPQPNPPADPAGIHLVDRALSPEKEIAAVVQSLERWLPDHADQSVAVLVPRNQRGFQVTDALKRAGIPYVELLRSTTSTRQTAGALGNVLKYLDDPISASLLARVFEVWRRRDREEALSKRTRRLAALIRGCRQVEEFLWPRPDRDWLQDTDLEQGQATVEPEEGDDSASRIVEDRELREDARETLAAFRDLVCRWQRATLLPIDQLILTISQDLFIEASELALSHKLALMLRAKSEENRDWRLPELTAELAMIARNQRRFLGFAGEETGFAPPKGKVTVATLHKAKGLEWDRVYIMSVNNYNFPSAQTYDEYIAERWFIRDRLNLEAEALEQLQALADEAPYHEGDATREARLAYVAERLRLLYVGITRAKNDLILTWNTGRSRQPKRIAIPFIALHTWWAKASIDTSSSLS